MTRTLPTHPCEKWIDRFVITFRGLVIGVEEPPAEREKEGAKQGFGEDVRTQFSGWGVHQGDDFVFQLLTDV